MLSTFVSLVIISALVAFNMYGINSLMRIRADLAVVRRAVLRDKGRKGEADGDANDDDTHDGDDAHDGKASEDGASEDGAKARREPGGPASKEDKGAHRPGGEDGSGSGSKGKDGKERRRHVL